LPPGVGAALADARCIAFRRTGDARSIAFRRTGVAPRRPLSAAPPDPPRAPPGLSNRFSLFPSCPPPLHLRLVYFVSFCEKPRRA